MSGWIKLTKTDNRQVEVNLDRANFVLRDERNYGTLIAFGTSDSITVLETPDEIFGRVPRREKFKPTPSANI